MPCMRVAIQPPAIVVFCLLVSGGADAYGPTGHRIVAIIAESHLCAAASEEVDALLQDDSLADVAFWADRIRGDPAWRHAAPWHFINVGDGVPVEQASGGERGDVLQAIVRFRAELGDASLPIGRRAEALRFLVHFVADVHQPLHVGRLSDRGGNDIDVVFRGKRSNLHALWDAQALLRADRSRRRERVEDQARRLRKLTQADVITLQRSPVVAWARESQKLRPAVYGFRRDPGGGPFEPDAAYLADALAVTNLRLSRAGVRLAGMLNGLFCREDRARKTG
ncbi:MAG: S1/P1 nuclease [Gammaproteobacteria bacterium]